jgi:hypothetical protein
MQPTETFTPVPDNTQTQRSPFRPPPVQAPPIDDVWQSGPDGPPSDYFSIGRAGQMQEAASNFGIGSPFGAGRGPGASPAGFAQLLAMRARLAGRPEQGPGSGAQGDPAQQGAFGGLMRRPYSQNVQSMRSGMFGMGGVANLPGGMAGALAALKGKADEGQMPMGQDGGQGPQGQMDLLNRFQPLGMMGRLGMR